MSNVRSPSKKMKTDKWKKLGIILGVSALAWVIIGIVTPKLLDLNRYQEFFVSEVEKAVGGKMKKGSKPYPKSLKGC
jgi:hypothetical protein